MSGNYRPRRRPGKPADGKGTSGKPTGKPSGKSTGKQGAADGAAAARRDTARRANLPRRTAYDVLKAVRDREAYANLLLPKLLAERQLTGRDAALATELAYGTLRGQGTYDAVLAACSDRPLAKLDPPVLDVLRLGAHQLLSTRVGAHAAVATSVDLAKSVVGPRVSGYVNAVLRRVATRGLDDWLDIVAPDKRTDLDGYLATRYSHPRWIVTAYRAALGDAAGALAAGPAIPAGPGRALAPGGPGDAVPPGPDTPGTPARAAAEPGAAGREREAGDVDAHPADAADEENRDAETTAGGARGEEPPGDPDADRAGLVGAGAAVTELEAALAAGNARPKVTLAVFPAGRSRADVMPAGAVPGRWSPYAFALESGDPAPLVESGAAAVQDEGSQLAAIALARAPVGPGADGDGEAELWLDLCAGPGGKSRLLYGLAAAKDARLTAAELHPHRAALVRDALTRARAAAPGELPAAEVLVADGTRPPWPDGTFDRVLVDAPCSGLGALRRRPEARWRKSPEDLKELTALQRDLLHSALRAVRPGGVVGYVTCSPVPAETSAVVAAVVSETPGTELLDTPQVLGDVPGAAAADPSFAQLWPHRHGTDAIFIALLRRSA
jgi:16S rRNA (cytosine967-C5)-methyltransferase